MEKTIRFKALIKYACEKLGYKNQREFARALGYTNDSSFSQIVTGVSPTPDILLRKLDNLGLNLNTHWLMTGEGEMLLQPGQAQRISGSGNITQQTHNGNNSVSNDDKLINIIQEQAHQLTTSQAQITELLTILKQKI